MLRNHAATQYFIGQGAFGDLRDTRRTGVFVNKRGELIIPGGLQFMPQGRASNNVADATTWVFTEEEYKRAGYAFILLNLIDEGFGNFRLAAFLANPYPSKRPELANWIFHDCWKKP